MLRYRPGSPRYPAATRRRGLALLVGATGLAALLLTGLGLSVAGLAHHHGGGGHRSVGPVSASGSPGERLVVSAAVARARDALAGRAMPDTGTGDEFGQPQVSTRDPGAPIVLPAGRGIDALRVGVGYPQTPQGALAELVSIDSAALRSASLPGVRAVISAWAAPGGPTASTWSAVAAMAGLLDGAHVSGAGDPALRVSVRPAMGLIKGTVGSDFVVACADFSVEVQYGGTYPGAAADCQRMLWVDGRWLIGPGREPAQPAQAWPDTDAAINAGFRDLTTN